MQSNKPLILDFKIPREEDNYPIIYSYSYSHSMNMIIQDGMEVPFIDQEIGTVELLTKTKVHREEDDEKTHEIITEKSKLLLEIRSKTLVARERDDPENSLLELNTKTRIQREAYDEHPTNNE